VHILFSELFQPLTLILGGTMSSNQNSAVQGGQPVVEFTWTAVTLGLLLGVVMAAANTYLGLYAGMTVSASIPAAVISMAILRGILRKGTILENNIVQTIASAGESLAAGIIFTVPALVLVGAWSNFHFWQTTGIAITGGLLGVIFMIPLRRVLICEEKDLTYPEGVACAQVLQAGEEGGAGSITIFKGLLFGGVLKLLVTGFKLLKGSVEFAWASGSKIFFIGTDISAALLGVGYIVNLEIAALVFTGGAVSWFVAMPFMDIPTGMEASNALDIAWTLWSTKIRYIGVGAMLVGGLWSIFSVRKGISKGLQGLKGNTAANSSNNSRTDKDMKIASLGIIFLLNIVFMFFLYQNLTGSTGLTILSTILMAVASFFFVAVSSYIVGLVGSSNNPVSGMTICTLLAVSGLFLVLGLKGDSAILATLGVAGVVCCAACTAGDVSQDLKTGSIVGATPVKQQIAQVLGVIIPAFVIAPVLTLLHSAYVIGEGLKAPQATLFASIVKGMFGNGDLPKEMVLYGVIVGIVLVITNEILKKRGSKFRTHVMPVAVGIYLPVTMAVPMLVGGIIRTAINSKNNQAEGEHRDSGILLASGLIAGESLMGIILAIFIYYKVSMGVGISSSLAEILSVVGLAVLAIYLYKTARAKVN